MFERLTSSAGRGRAGKASPPVAKDRLRYGHPAFDGLSESQVDLVFHHGSLRHLEAGEYLFREDGRVRQHYLVLDGALRLCLPDAGSHAPQAVLRRGEMLAAMPAAARIEEEIAAFALENLCVLEIEDGALSRLPEHVQALLCRNLLRLSSGRLRNMRLELTRQTGRQDALIAEFRRQRSARTSGYDDAPLIREFLQRIPRLPPYATRATMLLDDKASARDLVALARLDPSLTGIVLKTVNSAYYGLQQKVANFQHAALLLGFHQIYQIIVGAGIRNTMPRTLEFQRLQFHSMMISAFCFEICFIAGHGSGQTISTIGLLHDIGKSVILLLRKQNPRQEFFIEQLDAGKIGAMLLKEWRLPEEFCDTVEYQDLAGLLPPEEIPEPIRHHAAVLYLAHLCYEHLMEEGSERERQPALFLRDYLRLLKLDASALDTFVEGKLLPSMQRRLTSFPQAVQNFLKRKTGGIP